MGGLFLLSAFKFGRTQNIVRQLLEISLLEVELATFQAGLVELCLAGNELATFTSITGDVTTNPTTDLLRLKLRLF